MLYMYKMNLQNELIHKIKDYLPNEPIQFKRHKMTGDLQILFTNKNTLTSVQNCTWDEIKRQIDFILHEKSDDCSICCEPIKTRRTHCTKCARDWCINCYINIFRTNKGLIKCPFGRFTYGQTVPDALVEIGVQQILQFQP